MNWGCEEISSSTPIRQHLVATNNDDIEIMDEKTTGRAESIPKNHSCQRDVEDGRCDTIGHGDQSGVSNGRCEGTIGECNESDERIPLLQETGPIHAKILESNTGTIKPTYNNNSANDETISFREILPRDRRRIQELFEEWFPVEYKDEFYDHLCNNRSMGEQPLYTLLATVPIVDSGDDNQNIIACLLGCKLSARKLNHASRALLIPGYEAKYGYGGNGKKRNGTTSDSTSELDQAIDELESCGDPSINDSSDDKTGGKDDEGIDGTEVFYIMTLGVIREYRKRGLASYLLERALQDQIAAAPNTGNGDVSPEPNLLHVDEENPDVHEEFHATELYQSNNNMFKPICETAYLHVIIQNEAAIRFYEKLGFRRLREIANYYTINEEKHNCYLYAKFFDKESVIERRERAKGLVSYYCYYFSREIFGVSSSRNPLLSLLHRITVRWVTSIWSSVSYYWIFEGRERSRNSALTDAKNK